MIVLMPFGQSSLLTGQPLVDFVRPPDQLWVEVREETREDMAALLVLLYVASAEYHAIEAGADVTSGGRLADAALQRRLANAGRDYAERRAAVAAEQWTTSARNQFDKAIDRLQQREAQARSDDAARAAAQQADDAERAASTPSVFRPFARRDAIAEREAAEREALRQRAAELQKDLEEIARRLAEELAKISGPDKAARYATDETTAAQSAGGDAGVEATVGISLDDLWINRPDKSTAGPCLVCRPLHLTPRREWPVNYFDGPGPWVHPGCVCEIWYANMAKPKPAPAPPTSSTPPRKPRNYFETIGGRIVVARTGKEL